MKQRIRLTESQLKNLIASSVKRALREGLYPTWRGLEGSKFIWHGEWGDPEIEYDGVLFNGSDADDMLWEYYKEYIQDNGLTHNDIDFDEWIEQNPEELRSVATILADANRGDADDEFDEDGDMYESRKRMKTLRENSEEEGFFNQVKQGARSFFGNGVGKNGHPGNPSRLALKNRWNAATRGYSQIGVSDKTSELMKAVKDALAYSGLTPQSTVKELLLHLNGRYMNSHSQINNAVRNI